MESNHKKENIAYIKASESDTRNAWTGEKEAQTVGKYGIASRTSY